MVTGMPALAKHIAMPPPIVPAPMTAALAIGRLAFRKEDGALGLRLIAGDELAKQLGFAPQPLVEGHNDRIAHGLDTGDGRFPAVESPGQRLGGIGEALTRS